MKRLVLPEPKHKPVEGPRVTAKGFGGGTIVKDGPEVSLVQWDDIHAFPHPQFIPNKRFRRLL